MGERVEESALRLLSHTGEEWTLAIGAWLPLAVLVATGPYRTRPMLGEPPESLAIRFGLWNGEEERL